MKKIEIDPERIAGLAARKEEENAGFRYFIKHQCELGTARLKSIVSETAAFYWERFKCTDCGNCCRILRHQMSRNDIKRLSKRLGMKADVFVEKYLERGEEGLQMREAPCPFLDGKICSIYEDRPAECRGYPYLDRDIAPRMWGVIDRSAECPVVYNVLEELKEKTQFRRKRW